MPKTTKDKTTRFFRIGQLEGGDEYVPREFRWHDLHGSLQLDTHAAPQLEIDDHWFTQLEKHDAIGIHKLLDTTFMTRIDPSKMRVVDLANEESVDGPLAHSSIVLPISGPYFAFTLGGRGSPPATRLVHLLDRIWPLKGNKKWRVTPVMDRSKLDELEQSAGVVELQTRFTTQRTLLDGIDDDAGPLEYGDHLASQIGGDVEIELHIKLLDSERTRLAPRQNLKSMVLDGSRVLAAPNSKAKVRLIEADGRSRIVSLVESHLAAESEVPLTGATTRFSDLCSTLYGQWDELRAILDATVGGSDGADH